VPAPVPAPAVESFATRAMPVVEHNPPSAPVPVVDTNGASAFGSALGPVPRWMRLILWLVAVPVSFLVVFLFAIAVGVFTNSQLTDLFLATGNSRYWPVVRLLPFVALLCAALVHVGVYAIARVRGRG